MYQIFKDVAEFHERFGLEWTGPLRFLDPEMAKFRHGFSVEESDEWLVKNELGLKLSQSVPVANGDDLLVRDALAEQLDAFVDQLYVMVGTMYLQGFTVEQFEKAWERVHSANMTKVRAESAADSKRGSSFDVVKPADWVPPCHLDLIPAYVVPSTDEG